MERPMTTEELYNRIYGILKEKGKIPDILDYGLPAYNPVPITTYEFDFKNNLDYGSSEGIYLDLWMEYFMDGERSVSDIGMFKTLRTEHDAMHIMAGLLADFIIEGSAYVNTNLDDFTWRGADVYPIDGLGKRCDWGYTCRTTEAAMKKKDDLLEKYPEVAVRDNATRKETIYKSKEKVEK